MPRLNPDDFWVQTASGGAFDLINPQPEQVSLHDIAHHLARIARFNGATICGPAYSVAQHSLLVEALMPSKVAAKGRLVALLHDAHEAYVGDIVSPVQRAMRAISPDAVMAFNGIAAMAQKAVHLHFSVAGIADSEELQQEIRKADLLALAIERAFIMAEPPRSWGVLPEPTEKQKFVGRKQLDRIFSPSEAAVAFRGRMTELMSGVY